MMNVTIEATKSTEFVEKAVSNAFERTGDKAHRKATWQAFGIGSKRIRKTGHYSLLHYSEIDLINALI